MISPALLYLPHLIILGRHRYWPFLAIPLVAGDLRLWLNRLNRTGGAMKTIDKQTTRTIESTELYRHRPGGTQPVPAESCSAF